MSAAKMLLFLKFSSGYSRVCFYCLSFACVFATGSGYNFNTVNRKIFTDPNIGNSRASYFGFSAGLYVKTDRDGHQKASVVVGAPRANASAIPSVIEPGTVFNCEINDKNDNPCIEWNVDPTVNGEIKIGNTNVYQRKNNAWTGGSIGVDYSRIEYPKVVVCAPNWIEELNGEQMKIWYSLGMCYWSNGQAGNIFKYQADEKVIPFLQKKKEPCENRFERQYSRAGFSMHLYSEKNESRIMLGCPSASNATGVPILIEGSNDPIIPTCISQEKFVRYADHFGYAVTSGFYYDEKNRWHAASAPSPIDLMGKVATFVHRNDGTLNFRRKYKLRNAQLGQYFGASLASCDVDNDKIDEIIVGAPFWSDEMDEGRIYVFSKNFIKMQRIDGTKIGGRFGSIVTCLGDVDHDGYKDIAVGAPYEENHGAVYIYNGNKKGLNKDFSQRIYGEDISKGIRGFGAAISEPRDVDGNDHVDIAIGAPNSGHVVLLRSQPVIIINVYFLPMKKLHSNTTLITINVCSTYEGFRVPEELNVLTTLKVDPLKAYFGRDRYANGVYKQIDRVFTNQGAQCIPHKMTLMTSKVGDQIEISASLALVPPPLEKFCATCPVINEQKSRLNSSLTLDFAPYCGDRKCVSILEIDIRAISGDLENGDRYTLGSKSRVGFQVTVNNTGQAAYNTKLHFFVPSPLFPDHTLHGCEDMENNGSWEIICTLGNPLIDATVKTFQLDMRDVRSDTEQIKLFANVSSQSDIASSRNFCSFTINFDVDVDMAITGKSVPDVHSFDSKDEEQEQKSITSQHVYIVQKLGKSPMEESTVTIWVPTHLWEKNIEVARIIEFFGLMDEQHINCQILDETKKSQIVDELGLLDQSMSLFSDSMIAENLMKTQEKRSIEQSNGENNSKLYVPPFDRTFYVNCTNQAVKCIQISCKLNKFDTSNTVAKITVTLDVQMKNLIPVAMKMKDIIYFVSNASISGSKRSGGFFEHFETEFNSTSIGTILIGSPKSLPVANWIIVVSIFCGLLLLVLLILGLIKLGFFHRRKREELDALKAESDNTPGFVLETSSSREVLDAI